MSKIIVIVGPTGVGKTKLSLTLASKFNGEIINADSMQVYRNLDIGTAKVSKSLQKKIKHHLIDIKDVNEMYTVYDFQRDASACISDIEKRHKLPIIVGGTGLYLKALLYNYHFSEEKEYCHYDDISNETLLQEVLKYDPDSNVHVNNRKRLIRLLNKFNQHQDTHIKNDQPIYDFLLIGLSLDRNTLYSLINERVDLMINNGLIDEVRFYYDQNIKSKALLTGIGYKELYQYFSHNISLDEAIDKIKQNSRHYAKRQYTWFNNQMNVKWFEVSLDDFHQTEDDVIAYIEKNNV